MRKLIVSMNITLDGFMAGPYGELDWHFRYWNSEMAQYAGEELAKADTILLGRITYNAMEPYWPSKIVDMSFPREDVAYAELMNRHNKIVFSTKMEKVAWNNTKLVKEQARQFIIDLKQEPGKNIMVYGSRKLVLSLMKWQLIDEFALWIHPVALGSGKSLFTEYNTPENLLLRKTRIFSSGVIVVHYETSPVHNGTLITKIPSYEIIPTR